MLGVLVHDNRNPSDPVTMMAEKATLIRTPEGPRLYMVNGNRQQIDPQRHTLSLLYFDNYSLDLDSYAKKEGTAWREPSERYLWELLRPNMNDPSDVSNYNKLIVEGHRRIVSPLYVPALILIAIASVIGGEYNRRGHARRLVIGSAAAIALQVLSLIVAHLATKSITLLPLLYITPFAFMTGALLFLREPIQRRMAARRA